MDRIEKVVSNLVFFLLCLMTILLLFEELAQIPFWLQPLGRMHPLVLHFPIGFVVLLVLINLFRKHLDQSSYEKINRFMLLLTVLTTVMAGVMGFFLSLEPGYDSDIMSVHKWIGVGASYLMYILLLVYGHKRLYQFILYSSFIAIVSAGHFGAGLTHGMNFLTEPIEKVYKPKFSEQGALYANFIQPVLEVKCQKCHNSDKHKGQLDISTLESLHKGGENGPIWVAGDVKNSELIKRALLSEEDDNHMPPKGKPQLTSFELELLTAWIENGANETITLGELPETDRLYVLASKSLQATTEDKKQNYDFDFADEKLIASLNNPYMSVEQKASNSPAIDVNIYGRSSFQREFLSKLEKIKDKVVSLNLSYLPIEDDDLKLIATLKNLEYLNLNFTDISGSSLNELAACKKLNSLCLSGTNLKSDIYEPLVQLTELKEVYFWNSSLNEEDFNALRKQIPYVNIISGYNSELDTSLKLNPPTLSGDKTIISSQDEIILEHRLEDIEIRYTIDGSEPDSSSTLFKEPIQFLSYGVLKVKSYKSGWSPSETRTFDFFVKGHEPKNAHLINAPHQKYKGKGIESLLDNQKGKADSFTAPAWLGYQDKSLSALFDFGANPPAINNMTMSYALNMGQYIMAPTSIEVWGGNNAQNLSLIKKTELTRATKYEPNNVKAHATSFASTSYRYYKVVAHPLKKLPKWHSGFGDKGWVFVDEVFFY